MQLVRSDNGYHLWSETFDRTLDDIFQIQDDIARAVVDKLRLTLLTAVPSASAPATNSRGSQPLSCRAVLQGPRDAADLDKAVDCDQRALRSDVGYARAWAGLACSSTYGRSATATSRMIRAMRSARAAAEKALALDPTLGDAYSSPASYWSTSIMTGVTAPRASPVPARSTPEIRCYTDRDGRHRASLGERGRSGDATAAGAERDPLNRLTRRYSARLLYYSSRLAEAEAESGTCWNSAPVSGSA